MDVTSVFRDCVSQNQKSFKELDSIMSSEGLPGAHAKPEKRSVMQKSTVFPGKKSEHFTKAREISKNITRLRDFLKDCRTAYVNVGASKHAAASSSVFDPAFNSSRSNSDVPIMSDKERDQIDSDVQQIIQNCQKSIHDFQIHIETSDSVRTQDQLITHLENVINSLASYLKRVTQNYSEMRAIRVKRTVDYQSMSRLATHPTSSRGLKNTKSNLRNNTNPRSRSSSLTPLSSAAGVSETDGLSMSGGSNVSEAETTVPTYFEDEDDNMSPEELQIMEQENAALLNELNTLSQEVEQIESNVVEIAQLQEIFTEKVLMQERDIDRIGNVIVNATENIRGGNEQVRQAIQKSADFRAWVLFFIMVMSFSLLFLDWYND